MASFYESLTDEQKEYTLYFIGAFESSNAWDGNNLTENNQGDPFTLGMVQWAGTACYEWLVYMRDNYPNLYNDLPSNWRAAVDEGSGAALWGGYTMTEGDVNIWREACANHLDDIKACTQLYWCAETEPAESLYGELVRMADTAYPDGYGIGIELPDNPTIDQIKIVYYYLARFHNTGVNMARIYRECGMDTTLDELAEHTLAMYREYSDWWQWGDGWTRAINGTRDMLKEWDGQTCPDFGQLNGLSYGSTHEGGDGPGAGGDTSVTWAAQAKYIDEYGDSLCLHMADGSKTLFYKASNGVLWIPRTGVVQSGSGTPSDNAPASDASDWQKKLMELQTQYELAFDYTLDNSLTDDPPSQGYTNCSAWCWWCAQQIDPNSEMATGSGKYTGSMAQIGEEIANSNTHGWTWPYELTQPGDVLLIMWSFWNPDFDHVEIFLGTEQQGNTTGYEVWGAGYPPCPHTSQYNHGSYDGPTTAQGCLDYWSIFYWSIRRIKWVSE